MTGTPPLRLQHTFGMLKRAGDWHLPPAVEIKQRMGSTELDLTDATFESPETTIQIDMIGGSIELKVPLDIHVDADIQTTAASYQDHRKTGNTETQRRILLRGRAIWGSVEIR